MIQRGDCPLIQEEEEMNGTELEWTRLTNVLYALCIQDMNAEPVMRDMVEYSAGMTHEDFCAEHLPNSEYMIELLEQARLQDLAETYRELFPDWVRGE